MRRLDQELVNRGLCESREKAKRLVLAGQVRVNDQVAQKPSDSVRPGDTLSLVAPEKFVSRGGYKLEHALEFFKIDVAGWRALDLGASTGGFTDCLLQRGAIRVHAIDVGQGQLAWKLRQDARVVVMEKTNARTLTARDFPQPFEPVDLAVADCSFISLRKIIPPAVALLKPLGKIVALIKPQFEAGKQEADRGAGVIRDAAVHERVLNELKFFVEQFPASGRDERPREPQPTKSVKPLCGRSPDRITAGQLAATPAPSPILRWRGVTQSPLLGPAGNKEFLALIEKIT
jgi:23S rRNA (cytidine1920-2'-O)/16S rRNA (cytidine1409-2'-O)-methyltransferase